MLKIGFEIGKTKYKHFTHLTKFFAVKALLFIKCIGRHKKSPDACAKGDLISETDWYYFICTISLDSILPSTLTLAISTPAARP